VQPVVTVAGMRASDAAALASVDEAELVRRAGHAVAVRALALLGGAYGHRVVVLAGKGNNGADGKVAAGILARRGAKVAVVDAAAAPRELPACDLVVDAAYGTGFRGTYEAPEVPAGAAVLAVDVPSGVDGDTGTASGRPLRATATVTFAAWKTGLLLGDGPDYCGTVSVADIGVPVVAATAELIEDADVRALLPPRPRLTHKWASAVAVVAGSPGMEGAAHLAAHGAARAGAGMVRLAVPGADPDDGLVAGAWPLEAVRVSLTRPDWATTVLEVLGRCRALVVGPGLGREEATVAEVRRLVAASPVPVVVDADGLFALGKVDEARAVVAGDTGVDRPVVLTPHDGEYARLAGHPPGGDRLAAARELAEGSGAVALLKGSLTAVAAPGDGSVLLSSAGSPRLATAGTGDVLSGVIGAFLARGVPAQWAAALAAHVHGRAAGLGPGDGLVAPDLPELVAAWLAGTVAP